MTKLTGFRALVVDDDKEVRKKALEANDPAGSLEVLVASSLDEALNIIEENFLHVAVVDLELSKAHRQLAEGQTVLRSLLKGRPSCRRILSTKYSAKLPEKVFALLDPAAPVIDAAIDKANFKVNFDAYLKRAAKDWNRVPVALHNLGEVHELLSKKRIAGTTFGSERQAKVTHDELEFVLKSLFGQRMRAESADPDDIAEVTLVPVAGGKSKSVVMQARPVSNLGHEGLLCIVKVGPREDAEQELARYDRYVRMRMPLAMRVELLGSAMADGLGAIAYSFAGEDPGEVEDLQELLDSSSPDVERMFDDLFGGVEEWGGDSPRGENLAKFFAEAYGFGPHTLEDTIDEFADSVADEHGLTHRGNELRGSKEQKLHLPDADDFGRGLLHRSFRASVVHGDFNASNVILAGDGRSIIIDYRHTTRGPRALDLAAMHASIRLSRPACESAVDMIWNDEQNEFKLWFHDFENDDVWWKSPGDPPVWLANAAHLMLIQRRELKDVDRIEYAATCWLYALRVFRVRSIEMPAKLRLLVWISALSRVLAKADSAKKGQ